MAQFPLGKPRRPIRRHFAHGGGPGGGGGDGHGSGHYLRGTGGNSGPPSPEKSIAPHREDTHKTLPPNRALDRQPALGFDAKDILCVGCICVGVFFLAQYLRVSRIAWPALFGRMRFNYIFILFFAGPCGNAGVYDKPCSTRSGYRMSCAGICWLSGRPVRQGSC